MQERPAMAFTDDRQPAPPPTAPAHVQHLEYPELEAVFELLPPRQRQTLDRLILGDSEKQVALALGISRHTVHIYIKSFYRRLASVAAVS